MNSMVYAVQLESGENEPGGSCTTGKALYVCSSSPRVEARRRTGRHAYGSCTSRSQEKIPRALVGGRHRFGGLLEDLNKMLPSGCPAIPFMDAEGLVGNRSWMTL